MPKLRGIPGKFASCGWEFGFPYKRVPELLA